MASIIRECVQITFNNEFHQIEEFKKIKKPEKFEEDREDENSKYLDGSVAYF